MISYDKFESYMLELKRLYDVDMKIDKALTELSPDFGGFHNEIAVDLIMDLLKELTHDECDNIAYYIWELDWGKDWEMGCITDENGKDIPMKTIKDLYDYLESEYEN